MSRQLVGSVIGMTLCLAVTLAHAEPRGRSGDRSGSERSGGERGGGQSAKGKKPPGGAWSEYNPEGKQGKGQPGNAHNESGAEGAAAGHAAEKNKNPQASGAQGAAAGAAAANRNAPAASDAQGAAAGAAAANRNSPKASGVQGAAAGAAAANRNAPMASGAQGAAAGAAAANRKAPQYSGAQGAAAGATVANRNAPQYSGAQGAAAGAAVANRNAPAATGAEGAAAGYASVRSTVDHPGMYGQQWYGEHPSAWSPTGGWAAGAAWAPVNWDAVAGHCGYADITPVRYDYGSNVTCIDGNVVVNGQPAGTAEEFSEEADAIARAGAEAATSATDQWMPLGVFALVRNEHQHPQLIMQLAINQQGIVRGNYTDEVTDSTLPVHGEVDLQSRRAAWTVGDNRYSVIEAGLKNLTENEVPALVHKNGTTQRWLLVRLAQSSPEGSGAASTGAPQ